MNSVKTNGLRFEIQTEGGTYRSAEYDCHIVKKDGSSVSFSEAKSETTPYITGIGHGIRTVFSDFPGIPGLILECRTWVEDTSGDVLFELVPLADAEVGKIFWPAPFENVNREALTVLPLMQGRLVRNYTSEKYPYIWPEDFWWQEKRISCSRSMYMQFWGQYDNCGACMSILETRYDGGMAIQTGENVPTQVSPMWQESLGKVGYTRVLRAKFFPAGADYNEMAKAYRGYIKSIGELVTLKQKAAANPKVEDLIGRPIVHTYIWYHTAEGSDRYDALHPENNDRTQTFAYVAEKLCELKAKGLENACLHLDGWGKRGYDNQHPDYLPPAEHLGGWDGMKALQDTCRDLGYFFGIHDQFRDYFYDADTFDESFAVHNEDGTVPTHSIWMGGKQTYLCATQAPYYVKRNYDGLAAHGIVPDNAYLDVFSCVELDECFSPSHPMTREQCAGERMRCFNEVAARGILVQSEEGIDWAFPGLAFVHHAPFCDLGEVSKDCISVPLEELVYHDCLITPYESAPENEDSESTLFGFLCGGACYVPLEATEEQIAFCQRKTRWQKAVQHREMLRHEFVNGDFKRQKTYFAGGYSAEIDLSTGKITLEGMKE